MTDHETPPEGDAPNGDDADEAPPTTRSLGRRILRLGVELVLAVAVIAVGLSLLSDLLEREPRARRGGKRRVATLVTAQVVQPGAQPITLDATGLVQPARRVNVRPQVSGLVRELGPGLDPGALVAEGARLVTIEDRDYRYAVQRAQANLDQALAELALEEGNQVVARAELDAFQDLEVDEDLVLRKPQLAQTQARISAARAELAQARLNRSRTRVDAPFDAVIEARLVDVGASVQPGTDLFTLVGAERWWIEAQLPASELRWLRTPTADTPGSTARVTMPAVWGEGHRDGEVIQILPGLETEGRLARVLIEISDPLARLEANRGKPRLMLGAWVEIDLSGDRLDGVYAIERAHLRDGDNVWIMDAEHTLRVQPVEVAFRGSETVLVEAGLEPGDTLVTSPIAAPVEGMSLRTPDKKPPRGGGGRP